MSFKAEVQADSSGTWAGNALRFQTEDEAWTYARDLARRWTLVREYRVVESDEPATHEIGRFVLKPLAEREIAN